jgi:hypothetical protein
MRKYEESGLTKTIVLALQAAIEGSYSLMESYSQVEHPRIQNEIKQFRDLLDKIEQNQLDVSFKSRDY